MQIQFPWQYVPDPTSGRPVGLGEMYFGLPDLDPEIPANQIQVSVRQEDGDLIPVTQPIALNAGGVPTYMGSPVIIDIIEAEFSWKVLDSFGGQVYYNENNLPLVITGENIADGSITTEKLADGAVTTDKVADNSITEAKVTFDVQEPPPNPYSGGLVGGWDLLAFPTAPLITTPEDCNANPSEFGFMILNKADSTLYEFEMTYKFDTAPSTSIDRAFLNGKTLNLGAQLGGVATSHWMPKTGHVSVAGGQSNLIYQYNWAIPWDADSASYSGITFDHSPQTGGRVDSLTISEDFLKMWIATDMNIFEYAFGIQGDLSTAVLLSTFDFTTILPVPVVNGGAMGGTESYYRIDGGMLVSPDGKWATVCFSSLLNQPFTLLPLPTNANTQKSGQISYGLELSTNFDITTALPILNGGFPSSGMGSSKGFSGVENSTFVPFFLPWIPYDTVSPWADRKGIAGFDSPDGYKRLIVQYSTDNSYYFVKVNTPRAGINI